MPLLTLEEKKSFNSKLDRIIRQNTLLIYINLNLQDVIYYVFSNRIEVDSTDYKQARNKMLKNCRLYKLKICRQFKVFVRTMTSQDLSLLEISNNSFASKVSDTFTTTNYFYCFYFIKNYLNVKGSSELGKQFIKSIFVNIAVRIRKNLLIKEAREQIGDQNEVLEFFNKVALLLIYDDVDIIDFQ